MGIPDWLDPEKPVVSHTHGPPRGVASRHRASGTLPFQSSDFWGVRGDWNMWAVLALPAAPSKWIMVSRMQGKNGRIWTPFPIDVSATDTCQKNWSPRVSTSSFWMICMIFILSDSVWTPWAEMRFQGVAKTLPEACQSSTPLLSWLPHLKCAKKDHAVLLLGYIRLIFDIVEGRVLAAWLWTWN